VGWIIRAHSVLLALWLKVCAGSQVQFVPAPRSVREREQSSRRLLSQHLAVGTRDLLPASCAPLWVHRDVGKLPNPLDQCFIRFKVTSAEYSPCAVRENKIAVIVSAEAFDAILVTCEDGLCTAARQPIEPTGRA